MVAYDKLCICLSLQVNVNILVKQKLKAKADHRTQCLDKMLSCQSFEYMEFWVSNEKHLHNWINM